MSDDIGRVRVNLRIDAGLKNAFDEKIRETFGRLSPYAGIELERELRLFLDRGDITELYTSITDLEAASETQECKEKIQEFERTETTTIGYRVHRDIREEIMTVSDEYVRSPGQLVESLMYRYITQGSVIERLSRKLTELSEERDESDDQSIGATQRRTQTIASELDEPGRIAFDLADFEQAVGAAEGIGWSDYVRNEYVPRVLDELGFTWDPQNVDGFIDPECYQVPCTRDPTKKPYYLMDQRDKRLAIKVAAYRASKRHQGVLFDIIDAIDTLNGRPRKTTVRQLMREIANSSPGYGFRRSDGKMKVEEKEVRENPSENLDVIAIEHTFGNWIESATEAVQEFCDEQSIEVDDLPQNVLNKKIGMAKYPDVLAKTTHVERNPSDYITTEDREQVLATLNKAGEE